MKIRIMVFSVMVLLGAAGTGAQESHPPLSQATAVPPDARFELLHSELSSETFRLDKMTGEVWRMQRSSSKFSGLSTVWKLIPAPVDEERIAGRITYQLSTVRRTAQTLLSNVHTGTTWMLRAVSGELRWEPITHER